MDSSKLDSEKALSGLHKTLQTLLKHLNQSTDKPVVINVGSITDLALRTLVVKGQIHKDQAKVDAILKECQKESCALLILLVKQFNQAILPCVKRIFSCIAISTNRESSVKINLIETVCIYCETFGASIVFGSRDDFDEIIRQVISSGGYLQNLIVISSRNIFTHTASSDKKSQKRKRQGLKDDRKEFSQNLSDENEALLVSILQFLSVAFKTNTLKSSLRHQAERLSVKLLLEARLSPRPFMAALDLLLESVIHPHGSPTVLLPHLIQICKAASQIPGFNKTKANMALDLMIHSRFPPALLKNIKEESDDSDDSNDDEDCDEGEEYTTKQLKIVF